MNNTHYDILQYQQLIEQLFPNIREIPINSISSSVYCNQEDPIVYFLIIGDNALTKPFKDDINDEAKVKTVLGAEKNHNRLYYDLSLRFTFFFKQGKASFGLVFSSDIPELQKKYLEAFKQVERFRFIVMDQERTIVKVTEIDWYFYKNKKILQKVENQNTALLNEV